MKRVAIFGIGDLACLAYYYFSNDSDFKVDCFTVDHSYRAGESLCGLPVVYFDDIDKILPPDDQNNFMFIAIGYSKMNNNRENLCRLAKCKGYRLANYFSSRASILSDLGGLENCFIMENTIVQPMVTLESNVILWSGCCLCHHTKIEKNCFLGAGAIVAGHVRVEKNSFIGINSTVIDHIQLAKYSLIGAGSLINKNTDAYGVYYGVPAKKMNDYSLAVEI